MDKTKETAKYFISLKNFKELGVEAYTYNHSTEAEAGSHKFENSLSYTYLVSK